MGRPRGADGVALADGGEAVDVGVGEDGGEVGDEISPLSLSTLPPSPSSWQKVDREPALLPTNKQTRNWEMGGDHNQFGQDPKFKPGTW